VGHPYGDEERQTRAAASMLAPYAARDKAGGRARVLRGRVIQGDEHFHEAPGRRRRAGARKRRPTTATSQEPTLRPIEPIRRGSPSWKGRRCRRCRENRGGGSAASLGLSTSTCSGHDAGAVELIEQTVAAARRLETARKWWLGGFPGTPTRPRPSSPRRGGRGRGRRRTSAELELQKLVDSGKLKVDRHNARAR